MVAQCFVHLAHPLRIQGNVIEAHLPGTRIGEICEIEKSLLEPEVVDLLRSSALIKNILY